MNYTILSIDNSRQSNIDLIKSLVDLPYIDIDCCNGNNIEEINYYINLYNIRPNNWNAKQGELGVWFSQLNCWSWAANSGPLLVLEDDAIVNRENSQQVKDSIDILVKNLPDDWDFLSLCPPDNQLQDYYYRVAYDKDGIPKQIVHPGEQYKFDFGNAFIAKAYQGYCCVATLYSQQGAKKLLDLAREFQIYTPVDCFLFLQAHRGALNGYAPKPNLNQVFRANFKAPTTRNENYYAI